MKLRLREYIKSYDLYALSLVFCKLNIIHMDQISLP